MKQLLVLVNARAGPSLQDAGEAAADVLRTGADVRVVEVGEPSELAGLLELESDRTPVIVGGDGSIHALVAALRDLDRLGERPHELGIVPAGTGNDLARTLELPLDPVAAAEVILRGRERDLDIVVDDAGGVVVNALHLGVGAEAARRAAPLKPWLRRLAYPVGSLLAGTAARGWRLRVVVDGDVVTDGRRRVLMVALGNGMTIGGGAPVAPAAAPDDGQVDVVVSFSTSWRARLGFVVTLARGRHPRRPDVIVRRGHEVRVDGEPVPVNADGEVSNLEAGRSWTVLRHALRVPVPAP
ncbi:diacylglycerol kinase family protein [Haloactinopolyspora sp.]|uniref:diacylglycerol/lipid kinase family protein n=1 Tax=Haloactinopolyspora sp. TaxID=1966353 RepID=UPI002618BF9E|nr:diacylglycerol kinase family protein [Haloactinopolyspora sp.]